MALGGPAARIEMQDDPVRLRCENADLRAASAELHRTVSALKAENAVLKNTASLRDIERAEDKREVERLQACLDAACGRPTDDRAERALEWVKKKALAVGAHMSEWDVDWKYHEGQRDLLSAILREVFGLRVEEVPASVRFVPANGEA